MVNEKNRLIWAAGIVDGCGTVTCTIEQGPTRMYAALSLIVVSKRPEVHQRLIDAVGNGERIGYGEGYLLSGYDAVRGFIREVWPWLTPSTKRDINAEIRKYKAIKADLIARRRGA